MVFKCSNTCISERAASRYLPTFFTILTATCIPLLQKKEKYHKLNPLLWNIYSPKVPVLSWIRGTWLKDIAKKKISIKTFLVKFIYPQHMLHYLLLSLTISFKGEQVSGIYLKDDSKTAKLSFEKHTTKIYQISATWVTSGSFSVLLWNEGK